VETPTNPTIISVQGQSFAASSLFTYSDPFGSPATQYDFWDTGSGGGHFVLNSTPLGANQDNIITAAQLSQLTYQVGSGTDTLWVRANDGTVWGPWSPSFTVNGISPATVPASGTLELASAFSGTVTYAGTAGTLKIDKASTFSGTIGGQLATTDVIDLADVTAGAGATIGYTGTNGPGTLTVSDGMHTANIILTGSYSQSSFVPSSDGHGGTQVIDPPASLASAVDPPVSSTAIASIVLTGSIVLAGNYSLASFVPSSDGHGAIWGIDAPVSLASAVNLAASAVDAPVSSTVAVWGPSGTVEQRVAVLGNYMASTFADSGPGENGASAAGSAVTHSGETSFLTSPAAAQLRHP
jgi:hypothetical protein